jgi:hypothetical protein
MTQAETSQGIQIAALDALSADTARNADAARRAVLANVRRLESRFFSDAAASDNGATITFCEEPPLQKSAQVNKE